MSIYIGIDPGLSGAIAVITPYGQLPDLFDTPTTVTIKKLTKSKTKTIRGYDTQEMVSIIRHIVRVWDSDKKYFFIEKVHAMPTQGVVSMFNMGYGYGVWHGILASFGVFPEKVEPRAWKKEFGLLKTDKDASRLKAIELFPELESQLKRKKDVDRADALLIALYGKIISERKDTE